MMTIMRDIPFADDSDLDPLDHKQGVQSIELGMNLLRVMVNAKGSMMLKDIAAGARMAPSKAHRYLVSLSRAGLVEQDPLTSRYDLGSFALNIGLSAMDRLDWVQLGSNTVNQLRENLNETIALSVWSNSGATIVRWLTSNRPITINVLTGTALPTLASAMGRTFAAYLPKEKVTPFITAELAKLKREQKPLPVVEELLTDVRTHGLARVRGDFVHGVDTLAVPVFDYQQRMVMALSVIGVHDTLDMAVDGATAQTLRQAAAALSGRLGANIHTLPAFTHCTL